MTSGAIVVGALLLIEEFERRAALVNARHYVRLLGPFTQLLLALVSALAALVCAWLPRRWRYNRA